MFTKQLSKIYFDIIRNRNRILSRIIFEILLLGFSHNSFDLCQLFYWPRTIKRWNSLTDTIINAK